MGGTGRTVRVVVLGTGQMGSGIAALLLEAYLVAHSEADFTHGMCSGCQEQMRQRISAGKRPSEAPAS